MQEILLTAGTAFVGAAIVGGGLQAFNIRIPVIDSAARQLMLGGFGGVLIAFALLQPTARTSDGDNSATRSTPERTPQERRVTSPPASGSDDRAHQPPAESPSSPGTSPSEQSSVEGCVVTISNQLAPLKREPGMFSQDVMEIPSGKYSANDYATTEHAGSTTGWFQIRIEGRTGWVADDTWHIADKTSECP